MEIDYKKRYWVYVIEEYYPKGGVRDVINSFDTLIEAENCYEYWASTAAYEVIIWDMDERREIKTNWP